MTFMTAAASPHSPAVVSVVLPAGTQQQRMHVFVSVRLCDNCSGDCAYVLHALFRPFGPCHVLNTSYTLYVMPWPLIIIINGLKHGQRQQRRHSNCDSSTSMHYRAAQHAIKPAAALYSLAQATPKPRLTSAGHIHWGKRSRKAA
jgi:hypothetical protein